MARKKKKPGWTRGVRHRVVYWMARAASGLLGALPFDLAISVGRFLATLGYSIVWTERRRALEHLRLAYGDEMTPADRRRVAREAFATFGNIAAEMTHLENLTAEEMRKRVHVVDEDLYRKILAEAKGRGVILITSHLGAWEWLAQYGPLVMGAETLAVARELSNPLIQAWTERVRQAHGVRIVYRKKAGVATFRALKQGKLVGILLDQCAKGEGVFVPFFGRPAHTLVAPAKLALRTGAIVVPIVLIREDGGRRMAMHIEEPVPLPDEKNPDLAAYQLTASLTAIIEKQIRRHPGQWVWIHRRWKRRPEMDEDPVYDPVSKTVIPSAKEAARRREVASV